jgi:alkanesulfonate monooxygenase SsuD/methylene tetrahydromethanopterin reductase-like flavin-dependent oxidoreductase (luciferase family)
MTDLLLRWGVQPITYGLTWDEGLEAAKAVDAHGFDYLWGHDHLWSTGDDLLQPFFEGWTTITAWAALTEHVRLGMLVGANPFRNPGLVAKMAASVDHISGGRFVLGLGAGNREEETRRHGLETGRSVGERLDWLDGALTIIRGILDGEEVSFHSDRYDFDAVRQAPLPIQSRVPIVIGASGEKKGLRIVAKHADIWHQWLAPDKVDVYRHKSTVLDGHLDEAGRLHGAIERHVGGRLIIRDSAAEAERFFAEQVRLHHWDESMTGFTWAGTPEQISDWILGFRAAGIDGFSPSVAAPLDLESIERLAQEVRPRVDAT